MPESTLRTCRKCGASLYPGSNFCHQCGVRLNDPGIGDLAGSSSAASPSPVVPLFTVYSVVNNFRFQEIFYDNLKINWFVRDRELPPVPFEKAIVNYSNLTLESRMLPERFILERFTREETELLGAYLMTLNIRALSEECKLPVSENERGCRDMKNIPGAQFLPLHSRNSYRLPFKVEGYFNIQTADERVEGDDERPTVISRVNFEEIRRMAKH